MPNIGDRTHVRMEFADRVGTVKVYVIKLEDGLYTGTVLSWSENLTGIVMNGDQLKFRASEIVT